MAIVWSSALEIGIPVIDSQHQRIVDYINTVENLVTLPDAASLQMVIDDLIDYTLSHFSFEEELMEAAGYAHTNAHKKVHQLFTKRIATFAERAESGDDITAELLQVLNAWLINHIQRDDQDYSDDVKADMAAATRAAKAKSGKWLNRLFAGSASAEV